MEECLIESNIFLVGRKSNISDLSYQSYMKIDFNSDENL